MQNREGTIFYFLKTRQRSGISGSASNKDSAHSSSIIHPRTSINTINNSCYFQLSSLSKRKIRARIYLHFVKPIAEDVAKWKRMVLLLLKLNSCKKCLCLLQLVLQEKCYSELTMWVLRLAISTTSEANFWI